MGVCKISNFSIFTFINDSDLEFCTRSCSNCVYHMMRCKGSNGSHPLVLYSGLMCYLSFHRIT